MQVLVLHCISFAPVSLLLRTSTEYVRSEQSLSSASTMLLHVSSVQVSVRKVRPNFYSRSSPVIRTSSTMPCCTDFFCLAVGLDALVYRKVRVFSPLHMEAFMTYV